MPRLFAGARDVEDTGLTILVLVEVELICPVQTTLAR